MSYDIRFGVEVKDADGLIAEIGSPEYDTPTYNLGVMFRKCTGWNYEQGKWYKVADVLPMIDHGLRELRFNRAKYKRYEAENGWGTIGDAISCLESILEGIEHYQDGWCQRIPIEHLRIKW